MIDAAASSGVGQFLQERPALEAGRLEQREQFGPRVAADQIVDVDRAEALLDAIEIRRQAGAGRIFVIAIPAKL